MEEKELTKEEIFILLRLDFTWENESKLTKRQRVNFKDYNLIIDVNTSVFKLEEDTSY